MRKIIICLLFAAFISSSVAVAQNSAAANLYLQTSEVHHLMVQFEADRGSLNRFYFVTNSPERRARLRQLYADYMKQLQQLNFDRMKTDGKVDYVLFKRDIEEQQRLLDVEENEYKQVSRYFGFADQVHALERARRRGTTMESDKVAKQLKDLQKAIIDATNDVKKEGSIDMPLAIRAEGTAKGLQAALKSFFDFYNDYDPLFTWWVPEPYKAVDKSLGDYATALRAKGKLNTTQKDDGSGITGNPIGHDELVRQLELELIPYTPEQLVEIANKEFAWCDQEMLKASREMGFGDKWKDALEKVKNSYVPAGRQPEAIMKLYNESVDFLKKNDLITIPPIAEETWRMIMMTPQRQLVNPFFTGGEVLSISYPTSSMEEDDKLMSMRGNNPHFSRATVHHELIAGHHLQGFMNRRYKTYRNFSTPFWGEGWALYWELLLWDMKFPRSPEDRIGMLFWRMHRCARIIFSLNYHLGKWTPQQCIDFLVDRVGHERANATGEVRRSFVGGYSPLYQVAYMIGGLQFYALKKEMVDGGKMSYKQYHDAVLRENTMPVEMVRSILTNQPPAKDHKTKWRFYQSKM
jgi:uncharacterized protein (DUF885 family)